MEDYHLFSIFFFILNLSQQSCVLEVIFAPKLSGSGLKRQTQNLKQFVQKISDLFLIGLEKIIQLVIKCRFKVIKNIIAIFS